ncbi:Assimilatory nitrate reductase large subunit [hydrothermal vent metagenome]|uniref:Assimilatory nitrate reductase large subunit n=1 Tax=hydrothermal vent metagenome TaxID=652676 RepID=A0A3B1B913_9ZZZZ
MTSNIKTTCPYCGVGCGILAGLDETGKVTVKADPNHPANLGRLCSKGAALADTLSMEGRLLYPEIEGTPHSWENALDYVADKFRSVIKQHGPDAIGFYVSGQLLTEDYYVANKLMKGFIGSANIDTNSRLCMSSAVAAYKRAFGSDTVPCAYEDLERAKLVILTGSNTAWCHPVLYQRLVKAKKENSDLMVVVIDPRKTPTCDIADLHLPIATGTDHILFNGLLVHLQDTQETNPLFVNNHTDGLDTAMAMAREHAGCIDDIVRQCALSVEDVTQFYKLFARTERVVTVFSQGINQWSYGTDKANSIINCHLLSGRIGRPGMGPFSLTGQPNAMGGREVGGLANQLAAHMDINNADDRDCVKRFWNAPNMVQGDGLKAVDMFRAVAEGRIKALWIMATNPAVSLPDNQQVREALKNCELVVVSDCVRKTDTTQFAHVSFPAQTWGEREGTVTNSERRISRQRAFLPSPGQARPDWWIISEIAKHLGFGKAFNYEEPVDIFNEHAALSGFENEGQRDFNISGLATLSDADYEYFQPRQWPVTEEQPDGTTRMFSDGKFFTRNKRAQFIAVAASTPAHATNEKYPLVLNSGRVRDHWHTLTRTGKSARLSAHIFEPFVELPCHYAKENYISEGELVRVRSHWGEAVVRAKLSDNLLPGNVFMPIHWSDQFSSQATVNALVNPATDPVSGQPEFKHTPVQIETYAANWYGFLLSRRQLKMQHREYWSCSKGQALWRYEIAGKGAPEDWADCARTLLCQAAEKVEWVEYFDKSQSRYRAARIENAQLESCIFIGPEMTLPDREWLSKLFLKDCLNDSERSSLLTGRPANAEEDAGRIVCACFGVGIKTLEKGIHDKKLHSVEAVGEALRAGTNCGSCIPEIKAILFSALKKEQI